MESNQCDDSLSYLSAWLATASDWTNPAALHNNTKADLHDATTPPPSPPFLSPRYTPTSPASLYWAKRRGRGRKRKREGSMSDTASNASRETARTRATATTTSSFNIHLNKPILKATPPSSSRQRSPSPTRKVLNTLKHAVPSLRVCQPDARLQQPQAVARLRSMLISRLSRAVIPRILQVWYSLCICSLLPSIPCSIQSNRG
jgi:hypothetical protein